MNKRPIIIDTDPGIDDAVAIAIALFSEQLDVKLITTVAGNVSLEKVTYNVMRLLKYFGKENIPVAKGAAKPLIRDIIDASGIHGKTGMEGYDFEEPNMNQVLSIHAIDAMKETIMNSKEPVTIMPIGPLTNIALLLATYPEVKQNIKEIVLMGGSTGRGNSGVMAEFNIHVDPEAARMVFKSELPIVVAPLDVGLKALVYPEDSEQIKTMNKTGEMFYSLFKKYRGGSFSTGLKMYDSCAVAYLLKPEMYEVVETFVDVETQSELTLGCTVMDFKGYMNQTSNAKICVDVDPVMFKQWFMDCVKKCI